MGRPRARPDEAATTERLLAAATEVFAAHGFDGANLAEIAESVGITRPSLLYHYPSKQALYAAVITGVFTELGAALVEATESTGAFVERFDDVIRRVVAFFDERPTAATLILRELLDARGPGRVLLLEAGVPVLQRIERFVRDEGRGVVRAEVPLRAAMLQTFSGVLVRAAAGPLREPLWGKTDRTRALARILLFESPAPAG
ncbi:TetR/AcrR family transcriptional regulator [Myxococcota bacterium]|nr:TetR/AcrR family transcriptional regulator [Myxococcota bacterium]